MKMNENINPNATQNAESKIIGWLDDFGKQMHTRKNQSIALEQQISSLSRAYDQAQQKLLETQKLLMAETLFSDKQRSLIEVLKQMLNSSVDDDTTLLFIAEIEKQTDPKHQLHSQLIDIKQFLDKRKLNRKKEVNTQELRKELMRVENQNRQLMQDIEKLVVQNESLEETNQKYKNQLQRLRQIHQKEITRFQQTISSFQKQKNSLFGQIDDLKKQITKISQDQCSSNLQNAMLQEEKKILEREVKQFKKMISGLACRFYGKNTPEINDMKEADITPEKFKSFATNFEKKLDKYRTKLKQFHNKQKGQRDYSRQICLMKQFLSDEALGLFGQFEQQKKFGKLEHLEREILQLARLEKDRMTKLRDCEQKVWKYRVKLLRQDDSLGSFTERRSLSRSRSKLLSARTSKQGTETKVPRQTELKQAKQFKLE